jgi:hypothetical protein
MRNHAAAAAVVMDLLATMDGKKECRRDAR